MYPQHSHVPAQPDMHHGMADMGPPDYAVYSNQEHFSGNADMRTSQIGISPPNLASPLMNHYQQIRVLQQSMSLYECSPESPTVHKSDRIISFNPLGISARNSGELRHVQAEVGKLSTREIRISGGKNSPYMSPRLGKVNHLQHLAHLQTSFRTDSAKIGRGSAQLSRGRVDTGKNTNSQALVNNYSKQNHIQYSNNSSNGDKDESLEYDSSPSEKGKVQGHAMTTVAKDDRPRKKTGASKSIKRRFSLFGNLTADPEQKSEKKIALSAKKEYGSGPEPKNSEK
jgi:hypothetical protein